ncbi:hypothetical protein ACMXYO_08635 [Neptuniibacter sp. QD37_6]|uniref:hypothetical protein n=1 Tax=Neptuniibacter sp. QD37_6 TaxID=3398210 RepID=UPI0039F48C40
MQYPTRCFQKGLKLDWAIKSHDSDEPDNFCLYEAFPLSAINAAEVVKPSRMRLTANDKDVRFQTDSSGVSEDLELPGWAAEVLVTNGLLSPLNSTSVVRDQLYDQRTLVQLASKIKQIPDKPDGLVKVSLHSEYLFRFDINFHKILCEALSSRITAFRAKQKHCDLSILWIPENELHCLLISNLEMICESPVPIFQAGLILKLDTDVIKGMVKNENLKYTRGRGAGTYIDGNSLWKWITNQSILHRKVFSQFKDMHLG